LPEIRKDIVAIATALKLLMCITVGSALHRYSILLTSFLIEKQKRAPRSRQLNALGAR
jgi:hypothetical protein